MKKALLLISFAALLAMPSCMKDEVKEVNKGNAIGFRTSIDTRGLSITDNNSLSGFFVSAIQDGESEVSYYFKDVAFNKQGYDAYYSKDTYYWPNDGRKLAFVAYGPNDVNTNVTIEKVTKSDDNYGYQASVAGYTVNSDISAQRDLIFAHTDYMQEVGEVGLHFEHKLSRIGVRAYTSNNLVYKFAGVRICGIKNKGSMDDLSGKEWVIDDDATATVFSKELDSPITVTYSSSSEYIMGTQPDANGNLDEDYAFMIPQNFTSWNPQTPNAGGAYISVKLQVSTATGERVYPTDESKEYAWVAVPIPAIEATESSAAGWNTGYSYTYTLDFTNGAGYVDPDDDDDDDDTDPQEPVLGDDAIITVTATLNPMEEATGEEVANPNMIGEWKATSYHFQRWEFQQDENGNEIEGSRVQVTDLPLNDFDAINTEIDNFALVKILNGKEMWTKDPHTGEYGKVKYWVNDKNYILIECYRNSSAEDGSLDENDYLPRPRIATIVKAENGEKGYCKIELEYTGFDHWDGNDRIYEEEYCVIEYDITEIIDNE